jgi:hypothetical protein
MKLAEDWGHTGIATAPVASFHDEVEEVDEVDEAEDGCGGVEWQKYVLTKAHTSNKLLHELAREIRGVEARRGKRLKSAHYKLIFDKWESASKPFLRARHDYFTELLTKLDSVTVPKGETLQAAFERAQQREPPAKVMDIPHQGLRLLGSLCRELHEMARDHPIMLHQESIAKLFGHSHWRTIGNWIKALKTLGLLKLTDPAVARKKTARYFYIP